MPTPDEPEPVSPLQSYLELLRLPNVFTAAADVAMGFCFVQAAWAFNVEDQPPSLGTMGKLILGLLIVASAALYLAGMVLNDVFDIDLDREEQPYRPLPSGRISLSAGRWLGWNLLTLGVILAAAASILLNRYLPPPLDPFRIAWRPALVAAGLAVLIVLYNAGLKCTPLGPLAMGGCRTLNVLLGMSVLREAWRMEHYIVAAGVGVYIAGVTWFARDDARRSQRWQLAASALVMLAGIGLVGALPWACPRIATLWMLRPDMPQPLKWECIVALLGFFVIARAAPAIAEPSPGPVRAAVGRSITALIFLDAAACYAGAGAVCAVAIAVLVVPAVFVGRWVRG